MWRAVFCCGAVVVLLVPSAAIPAQQIQVGNPLIGVNEHFFEQFNVGWGFRRQTPRGSMFFQFGGPAFPPFGGIDPNVGTNVGIANRWGNGDFFFNFSAAQGYQSSMNMTAPSVTLTNGVPGFIQDVTLRPFVTGFIPVVGYPTIPYPFGPGGNFVTPASPLAERIARLRSEAPRVNAAIAEADLARRGPDDSAKEISPARRESTAQRGELGVAEIRRQQAAEDAERQAELERIIAEGRAAEAAGQFAIARVRYQQAAARLSGEQRQELLRAAQRLK